MSGVAVIPARGGSRRIPRKNIRLFHGKPIIAYSIEAAKKSQVFRKVFVSTDDEEIADVARQYGADVIKRPAEFARDEVGTQEVMRHAIRELPYADIEQLCCIYATAPLIDPYDLGTAAWVEMCAPAPFVVAVGAQPLRDIGMFYFGNVDSFMRHPLYGLRTRLIVIPEERAIDINTEDDWLRAERAYVEMKK